jgi:uracil-DNA glycosylase family 4
MKIENLNKEIEKCTKCRLKESRINALPGEGNLNAKVILIAQSPGKEENKKGKMFIGPTGGVLDNLFKKINLKRNEIYMTNLIKCMLPNYRAPKQDEIDICSQYLNKEIEIINPDTIAPLGYYSTRYIFEKYSLSVPEDKNEFKELCGRIFLTPERKILPLLHPTTLLFIKNVKDRMIEDYSKIKTLLKDCKWYPSCPMKRFYEKGVLDRKWIELYCKGDWLSCVRYTLEERGEPHPDWMLPDGSLDKNLRDYIDI